MIKIILYVVKRVRLEKCEIKEAKRQNKFEKDLEVLIRDLVKVRCVVSGFQYIFH